MIESDELATVVMETCVVTDSKGWWIDTGATRHIIETETCSLPMTKWMLERGFTWEMLQPSLLKEREMRS